MAGLLGDDEEQRKQSLGLLGLLIGGGIMGGNQPGSSMGQAFGQGVGQGVQGLMQMQGQRGNQELRALQMQKLKADMAREQGQQSAQAALFGGQDGQGINWNSPRPMDQQQKMAAMGQAFPEQYGKAALTSMFPNSSESPSSVKEWEYFSKLPKEAQAQYLTMKRANPYLDLGGQMVQPNPVAPGQPMGGFNKTLTPGELPETRGAQAQAAAAGGVVGKNTAEAELDLPTTIAKAEQSIKLVDDLIAHPGLKGIVGAPESVSGVANMVFGSPIPGTKEADFKAILDQVGGQQFLQAFETLKGGGQITQIEGEKATRAISRLTQTGQSEAAYKKAAQEFKEVIQAGINRAKMKAGSRAQTPMPQSAPAQSPRVRTYNPATGQLE